MPALGSEMQSTSVSWENALGPIHIPDRHPVTVEDPEGVVLERLELYRAFEMLVKIRLMLLSIAGLPGMHERQKGKL